MKTKALLLLAHITLALGAIILWSAISAGFNPVQANQVCGVVSGRYVCLNGWNNNGSNRIQNRQYGGTSYGQINGQRFTTQQFGNQTITRQGGRTTKCRKIGTMMRCTTR